MHVVLQLGHNLEGVVTRHRTTTLAFAFEPVLSRVEPGSPAM